MSNKISIIPKKQVDYFHINNTAILLSAVKVFF